MQVQPPHQEEERPQQQQRPVEGGGGGPPWGMVSLLSIFAFVVAFSAHSAWHAFSDVYLNEFAGEVDAELPDATQILQEQLQQVGNTDPKLRVTLLLAQGNVLRSQGRYAEAGRLYAAALKSSRTQAERSDSKHMIGKAMMGGGRFKGALAELEVALQIMPPTSANFVHILHDLGDVHVELGQIEEGVDFYTQAYEVSLLVSDDDKMATVAADISEAWARKGLLDETTAWLMKAREHLDKSRLSFAGVDKIIEAKVDSFVGASEHLASRITAGLGLYRKAFHTQARLLRQNHPDLVATQLSIARAHRDLGEVEEALRAVRAVEDVVRQEPQEGPDLSRTLIVKSDLLRELGDMDAAQEAVQEAMTSQVACFQDENHPEIAISHSSLGSILHDAGFLEDALEHYKKSLSINLRTVGDMHPETASSYNSLGTIYQDSGDDILALDNFVKCLRIQYDTLGLVTADAANTLNNLATVRHQQGQSEEAAGFLRNAIKILDEVSVGASSPWRLLFETNLGQVNKALGGVTAEGAELQDRLADLAIERLVGFGQPQTEFDDLDDDFDDHPARRLQKSRGRIAHQQRRSTVEEDDIRPSAPATESVEVITASDDEEDVLAALSELLASAGDDRQASQFAVGADATFLLQKDAQVVKKGAKKTGEGNEDAVDEQEARVDVGGPQPPL